MTATKVASALGDPVRLRVLELLVRGRLRVREIAAEFPISRPAISRHLRVLRECGLVELHPSGRETFYSLVPGALEPLSALLARLRRSPTTAAGRQTAGAERSTAARPRRSAREMVSVGSAGTGARRRTAESGGPSGESESWRAW